MPLCKKGFCEQMQVFNTRSYKAGWIDGWMDVIFKRQSHICRYVNLLYSEWLIADNFEIINLTDIVVKCYINIYAYSCVLDHYTYT